MTEAEEKEKMNELMNKISFALKDDILAQGFEIICKRILELESDLKVARNDRKCLVRTKRGHYSIQELMEVDSGVVFDDYEWEDVDAWAELPEV